MNIVALSLPFPGAKRPLEEGAKLGMWTFILLGKGQISIPPADIFILAAWHPAYEQLLGLPGRIGVLWTSSAGEMDFTPVEQHYLNNINRDPQIDFIWFGDPSLARVYPRKGFYAPYPFDVDEVALPAVEKRNIVTLFCPTGMKKAIYPQLLAVKLIQGSVDLTLHTNIQGYDHILNELDCQRYGWLPDEEYKALVASARINLAVSWAETYHYQGCEAALMGTPSVGSRAIPWLPKSYTANPNSPLEIAAKMKYLLMHPEIDLKEHIRYICRKNNAKLMGIFQRL